MRKVIDLIGSLLILYMSAGCHHSGMTENSAIAPAKSQEKKEDSAENNRTEKNIIFYGNSITAGYGIDPLKAFPALIQAKLDALNLPYRVVNAGLSGETSAGGNSRIDWILHQPVYIFVLELGGNDGLRGISLSETSRNLQQIIDKVKGKYPSAKIVLAGMQIPPNLGQVYTSEFRNLFQHLAVVNKIYLIPFLLEGVGGVPSLNQQDGIHPNVEGHKIVAENIWKLLKPLL